MQQTDNLQPLAHGYTHKEMFMTIAISISHGKNGPLAAVSTTLQNGNLIAPSPAARAMVCCRDNKESLCPMQLV